jgi:hypothetical protein
MLAAFPSYYDQCKQDQLREAHIVVVVVGLDACCMIRYATDEEVVIQVSIAING